jgi:uncharacterized repeat protein (TIGR02543 family)
VGFDGNGQPLVVTNSATYAVTYALGGGTGTLPTQASEASGATFTVAAGSSLSRSGYTFAGWNDGTTTYQSGATYTMGSSAVTLTALWTPVTSISWSPQEISLGMFLGNSGQLDAISCASAATCTAVGYDANDQPLFLTGNPSNWTASNAIQITLGSGFGSSGYLEAISCTSATTCTAVGIDGNGEPLVLTGNPSSWTASNATEITLGSGFSSIGHLYAISCASAATCTAVGYDGHDQPLVLTGNPSSWTASNATQITLGSGFGSSGYLEAISCASATTCTAVGIDGNNQPLVLTGNPSSWTASNATEITLGSGFGSNGSLRAISCTSAATCTAVGYDGHDQPLVLTGNPSSWSASNATEITLGSGFSSIGHLYAISCASATTCTAVGYDGNGEPLVLTGNPSSWTASNATEITLGSGFGSNGSLQAISCTSAATCTAVGIDGHNQPLVVLTNTATNAVTYALGGGTGTVPTQASESSGATFTVASGSSLSRSGYTFAGWNDGTTTYQSGATYTMGSSAVTLTALWTPVTNSATYAVTYVLGGGTGTVPPPRSEANGATFTVASGSSLSRSGYTFAGWNNGTTTYQSGATYTVGSSAVTLTALWTPVTNSVTYAVGGGTGTVPTQASESSGATFTVASGSSLSRSGDTFAGWNDGTTTYHPGATYTVGSSAVTLTAQWTPIANHETHLTGAVYFSSGSAQLTANDILTLAHFATSFKHSGRSSLTVVGYTDATGSRALNRSLSLRRAQSVAAALRRRLTALGLEAFKIQVVGGGASTTSNTPSMMRKAIVTS